MTAEAQQARLVEGYLNPLAFHGVEEPWQTLHANTALTESEILRYLVCPDLDASKEAVVARFLEISVEGDKRLFMAPRAVLELLVWPLRYAKGSYAVGNFIGSMALCGMVCESACIFIFESHDLYRGIKRNGLTINERFKKYFAKGGFAKGGFAKGGFAKAGQAERINTLATIGLVSSTLKETLHLVRSTRNRYLHYQTEVSTRRSQDAVKCFLGAVDVVAFALGFGMKDGTITLRPEVYAWMDERSPGGDSEQTV